MPQRLKCPGCGKTLQVADKAAGKRVKCKSCQHVIQIPSAETRGKSSPSAARRKKPSRNEYDDDLTDDLSDDSQLDAVDERALFKCRYGQQPKLMLYGGAPFLLICSIALFVAAAFYGWGLEINSAPIPPWAVAYIVSPLLFILAVCQFGMEIYQRKYPRHVTATEKGLTVPKGVFSRKELHINWKGLKVGITSMGFLQQVSLKNKKQKMAVNLASPMFATAADFEKFLKVVGKRAQIS